MAIAAIAAAPAAAEAGETARARAALDGDTLALADGSLLRLIGIRAPKGEADKPFALAARDALDALAAGRTLTIEITGAGRDRHGRILAHARREDGVWLQGAMLEAGLARVETFADNRARAAEMLALEDAARKEGRGLWRDRRFRVLTPGEAERAGDGFHLVEGRVERVTERRGRFYLDFGADWRSDFTVAVASGDRPRFRALGLDPAGLEGARLRVRGWMHRLNGPMIDATHPEQIERLRP
jgi:endonuclease YncB( thermonuclease family)